MKPNLSNRFIEFDIAENELEMATTPNPYFFGFLQNKIAAYANQVIDFTYDMDKDVMRQVIEHEKLKACVLVLEELMRELNVPQESQPQQSQSKSE